MRRQDEILEQFERADPLFRRVLLDLAGDLGPVYDSARLQALLRESLGSPDAWTRAIAMVSCLEFEASWVPARLRLGGPAAGTWTSLHLTRPDASGGQEVGVDPGAWNSKLRRALLFRLSPAIQTLAGRLAELPPTTRALGCLCLSRTPTRATVKALGRVVDGEGVPEAALALAAMGTEFAHGPFLDYLASEAGSRHPQALAGLRFLGAARTGDAARRDDHAGLGWPEPGRSEAGLGEEALAAQWRRHSRAGALKILERACRDPNGQAGLGAALALAGFPESCDLLGLRLARRPEPGLAAHVLIAIARAGEGLGALRAIHDEAANPFLQVLVVRAAGTMTSPEAGAFLRQIVEEGGGNARALALELAVRARLPLPEPLLARLLSAENARVRLNAALALLEREPERALPVLKRLLASTDAGDRSAGVFALAYLQGEASAKLLKHFLGDPDSNVRFEAVSSLGRHRCALAGGALADVALGPDDALAARALQALAWWGGEGAADLATRLAEALTARPGGPRQAELFEALGGLAGSTGRLPEEAFAAGVADEEPGVAAARLEAMALAGLAPSSSIGGHGQRPASGALGARMALAELLAGNLEATAILARLLEDDDGAAPAIEALWQVLLLAPWLGFSPKLRGLEVALKGELCRPGWDEFSARELGCAGASGIWDCARQPREADPEPLSLSVSRSQLAPWATELAGAPRPAARGRARLDAYYSVPAVRRRGLYLGAAALAAGALLLWAAPGRRGSEPPPARPAVVRPAARALPQTLSLSRFFGDVRTEPGTALGRGHLRAGERARVDSGELELKGPYPSVRLVLKPGELTLGACSGRGGKSLGTDLAATVGPGRYRIDVRAAGSGIELKAAGQTVQCRGGDFELEVGARGASLQVRAGSVRLTAPAGEEVSAGGQAAWGEPPAVPEGR